jgi:hypothetical protein
MLNWENDTYSSVSDYKNDKIRLNYLRTKIRNARQIQKILAREKI